MQFFVHNGKIYKQLKGLSQGSCDTRTLCNILLGYQITRHQFVTDRYPEFSKIFMYEDEFLVYISDGAIPSFVASLERCTNLKFKLEKEQKFYNPQKICGQLVTGSISFLDIQIYRGQQSFLTSFHDTNYIRCDGQMCHSIRNLPIRWKNAVLQGHFRRVFERVSNPFLLKELYHLEQQFRDYKFSHVLHYITNHYLDIYKRILSGGRRHYSQNAVSNFGRITERIAIMRKFLEDNYTSQTPPASNKTVAVHKRRSNWCDDNWQAKRLKPSKISQ